MGDDSSPTADNDDSTVEVEVSDRDWSDETDPVASGGLFGYSTGTLAKALGFAFLVAVVMEVGAAVGQRLVPTRD